MGWTGVIARYFKNGKVDRKAEVENECLVNDKYEVIKTSFVGTTAYRAVREKETGEVIGEVILTRTTKDGMFTEFAFKDMDETMEPYYYDCPNCILKLLTPTDNEYANKWREECRKNNEAKKAERKNPKALKNLPYGSVIEFDIGDGRKVKCEKMSPCYQFKTDWYYVLESGGYYPKKYIPKNYEVIA